MELHSDTTLQYSDSEYTDCGISGLSTQQSSVSSRKTLNASRHIATPDFPRDAQVEQSDSHVTAAASSQSSGSPLFPATSMITRKTYIGDDDPFSFIAPPDVRNDPVALPTHNVSTIPLATLSKSYFSQDFTNIQHLAYHISSLAYSSLSSLRQKWRSFSFPNLRNLSLLIISFSQQQTTVPQERLLTRTGTYASGQTYAQVAPTTVFSVGGSLAS